MSLLTESKEFKEDIKKQEISSGRERKEKKYKHRMLYVTKTAQDLRKN